LKAAKSADPTGPRRRRRSAPTVEHLRPPTHRLEPSGRPERPRTFTASRLCCSAASCPITPEPIRSTPRQRAQPTAARSAVWSLLPWATHRSPAETAVSLPRSSAR